MVRGSHVLKVWSTTQATIALSSAEAELIAAVRGTAEGLAMQSVLRDLGAECSLPPGLIGGHSDLPQDRRWQDLPS